MGRADTETVIVWKPSAAGASLRLRKDKSSERSVEETIKEFGLLSVPPENRSDVKLYCMIQCILTTTTRVASQMAFVMSAKTDILKNNLLLLLHPAGVTAPFHANMEVFKRSKARRITVNNFYSIVQSRINHAHNGILQATRLI